MIYSLVVNELMLISSLGIKFCDFIMCLQNSHQDISTAISECSSLHLADIYDSDSSDSEDEPLDHPAYSPLSGAGDDIPEHDVNQEGDDDDDDNDDDDDDDECLQSPSHTSVSWRICDEWMSVCCLL